METILVVDDTKININILVDLLGDSYDVIVALNGKTALEFVLEEEKIDLILLDIMMPDMDGYEVCDILQNDPLYDAFDIPIIFITTLSNNGIKKDYNIDKYGYITKPFQPNELLSKVKSKLDSIVK